MKALSPITVRGPCKLRHSNLPGTPFAVGAQRGGTTHHLRPYDISDALATLHWLRVPERVQCKIAVLTFKVLQDSAPRYLEPLVAVADLPGRRALRSASTSRLVVPPIKLSILLAAVLFRLPQLKSETVCLGPSSHRHHCRLSAVN